MMTPLQEQKLLDATASTIEKELGAAYDQFLQLLDKGTAPRDAVSTVMKSFRGAYAQDLAKGFSEILQQSVGAKSVLEMNVAGLSLSKKLYKETQAVSGIVAGIIDRHAKGWQAARSLTTQIFQGYGLRPTEILKLAPGNSKLPKYLREELLTDQGVQGALARNFARAQALSRKTPALKAAYLEYLDAIEQGVGRELLDKKLQGAFYERMRYFANRIAQTELHRAYALANARELLQDEDVEWVQYRMSRTHPRTDICDIWAKRDLYGKGPGVYPKGACPLPPIHPHCLPGDALITSCGRITAASKRWYDGDLAVITTASGKRISATVNHPVLTRSGWIGAGLIDIGNEVVSRVDSVPIVVPGLINNDHENMPASISEIFDAFVGSAEVSTREVPLTAENFHGDGMAGEVAIIGADRKLWNRVDEAAFQVANNQFLGNAGPGKSCLFGECVLDLCDKRPLFPPDGVVSSRGKGEPFFTGESGHSEQIGFASSSNVNPAPFQYRANRDSRSSEPFCDRKAGFSGQIGGDDKSLFFGTKGESLLRRQGNDFCLCPQVHSSLNETSLDSLPAESILAGEILEGKTGEIVFDCVVQVDVFAWSGHVFNLETEDGYYECSGIVTHNCRCVVSPRLDIMQPSSGAKPQAGGDREFLMRLSEREAARVMGSKAKAELVLSGKEALAVYNAGTDSIYRVFPLADAVARYEKMVPNSKK